jgi:hypothetical protein
LNAIQFQTFEKYNYKLLNDESSLNEWYNGTRRDYIPKILLKTAGNDTYSSNSFNFFIKLL